MSKTQKQQNGWREVTVQDLIEEGFCVIKNNLRKPISSTQRSRMQGKYPYYGAAGQIDLVNDYRVEGYHLLVAEDGTVTSNGINPMLQLVDGKFWVSNHAHIMQGKTKQETLLLYYMLSAVDINTYITGAVQPKLSKTNLLKITLNLPPLPEQKAIAEVLSSLDDKIDLFHRQNKTLEDMAQALFRKWFIEEAKEDWKEVKLGDYFPVVTGKKDANYSSEDGQYPFFTCAQGILKAPDYSFEGSAILLAGNGDFNVKRYVGKFEAYQRTYVLIPHEEKNFGFLYTLIKYHLDSITGGAQGSVISFITKGMITEFKFSVPKINFDEKLEKFNEFYAKIDANQSQIRTLENLRDTLLPKLMTGAVRVKLN